MNSLDKSLGDTLLFSVLILLTVSIIRMGASIYLPAMPIIGEHFGVSASLMSNTLTVYFIIFASFIIIAGMLSDAYGRRKVLLSGIVIFIVGSTVCALSKNFEMLLIGRAFQAFGASMIPGTITAIVKDACSQTRSVKLLGWIAVFGALFLVVAPVIGGFLTHIFGWSANFWFLVIFTFTVFLIILAKIPETHLAPYRQSFDFKKTFKLLNKMIIDPSFIIVMLPIILFFALQGAFLSAAPYILMEKFKLSSIEFGISNLVVVAGLFLGQWLGISIFKKQGFANVYKTGMYLSALEAVFLLIVAFVLNNSLSIFLLSISFFAVVFGMLSPVGLNFSLVSYPKNRGVATSLQGTLMIGSSAIGSALFSTILHYTKLTPLSSFSLICATFCILVVISITSSNILSKKF